MVPKDVDRQTLPSLIFARAFSDNRWLKENCYSNIKEQRTNNNEEEFKTYLAVPWFRVWEAVDTNENKGRE